MGNCVNLTQTNIPNDNLQHSTQLDVYTWSKESHGLFDYESSDINQERFQINKSGGCLIRAGGSVMWVETINQHQNFQTILEVKQDKSTLKIQAKRYNTQDQLSPSTQKQQLLQAQNQINSVSKISQVTMVRSEQQAQQTEPLPVIRSFEKGNKLWSVISSIQPEGTLLQKNDIIKLGRIKMRVREINLQGDDSDLKSIRSEASSTQNLKNQICKVCLSDQITQLNPLLNPCKCSGTMKYIHLDCLQTWLRQKLHQKQNDHCTIYLWKDLSCELCKFKYKPVFTSDGIKYDLVELSQPKGVPFILLELHSKNLQPHEIMDSGDTFSQKACGIYIINFSHKQEIKLGRGHENEVRVSDISVSRCHSSLTSVDNQKVILKDLKSKFGTLILLKSNLEINPDINNLKVQIGRSVIQIKTDIEQKSCCF